MKKKYLILILLFLSVIAYHSWFSFAIFTEGDWGFGYAESLAEYIYPTIWAPQTNSGSVEQTLFRLPVFMTQGFLATYFGFDSVMIDKLVFFWQIIFLLPVASFLFISSLVKNNTAALIGSFALTFNTYFLTIDTAGHGLITVAVSFALLGLYFLLHASNYNKLQYWFLSMVLFLLSGVFDFRVVYIIIAIAGGIYVKGLFDGSHYVKFTLRWVTLCCFLLLTNVFWIIPIYFLGSSFGEGVLDRPLFGDQFWSLSHAITLTHPFWTGVKPIWFSVQPIPVYFWLIPIIATAGLVVERRNFFAVFFGFIAVLGIFLSKQSDVPFESFYHWAYTNVPGFNAFREATKFYIFIAISYGVLIAFFTKWILENAPSKFVKYIFLACASSLFLINTIPMVTGSISTMFVQKTPITDYALLKDKLVNEKEFYRTYWTPIATKWIFGSNLHPKGSLLSIGSLSLFSSHHYEASEKIKELLTYSFSDELLDSLSIKYIGVLNSGAEVREDNFINYGGKKNPAIRDWYLNQLDPLAYLERVDLGTQNLVMFENKNYLPYIRTMSSVTSYESLVDLDNKYIFTKNVLNRPLDFVISEGVRPSFPVQHVVSLFENPRYFTLDNEKISQDVVLRNPLSSLYVNTSAQTVSYQQTTDSLKFNSEYISGLSKNSKVLDTSYDAEIIDSIKILNNIEYIAEIGSRVLQLVNDSKWHTLYNANQAIRVYRSSSENKINNSSFEGTLWQSKVGDCYNYDQNPDIGMTLSTYASQGANSLELNATRHIACTSTQVKKPLAGGSYIFSFDYQSFDAESAGFYLSIAGSTTTVITERLPISDVEWATYQKIINIPDGMSGLSIFFYAYENDQNINNSVRYDNVILKKLTKVSEIIPRDEPTFVSIPIEDISTEPSENFSYQSERTNFENIIKNGNLTNGLWKTEVGDCNDYDESPNLDMRLVHDVRDNGESLELEATRHSACTGPAPVSLSEGRLYLLSFDYQSDEGNEASFYLSWSGTQKPAISEDLKVLDSRWHTFSNKILIPQGATGASLFLYAHETDGLTPTKVRYDNLKLIELPDVNNRYYIVETPKTYLQNPKQVLFELSSPTKKLVHIKGATTPFYIGMSESYHPKWQLQFTNQKITGYWNSWVPFVKPDAVADEMHFKLNDFLNGWYVDVDEYCKKQNLCIKNEDGSYDIEMTIEFFPQRWFYLGLLISGTTLFGCIVYLGYEGVRSVRRRMKNKKMHVN